jgi:hypothetical protein
MKQRSCDGRGARSAPFGFAIRIKKTGARSARARTRVARGQNQLVYSDVRKQLVDGLLEGKPQNFSDTSHRTYIFVLHNSLSSLSKVLMHCIRHDLPCVKKHRTGYLCFVLIFRISLGLSCRYKRFLFCLGCSSRPSTKYFFPHH